MPLVMAAVYSKTGVVMPIWQLCGTAGGLITQVGSNLIGLVIHERYKRDMRVEYERQRRRARAKMAASGKAAAAGGGGSKQEKKDN